MRKTLSPISLILFCWIAIFILCPLIYVFGLSFLTREPSGNVVFEFTLDNYSRIFSATYFKVFIFSIVIALTTSLFSLLVGYPFAYFVAKLNKKFRFFVVLLVMIPFWTSSLLRTYGWIILLQPIGVINSLLMWIGVINEPLQLMNNYITVLVATIYMLLPFMILPIYNAVEKLDKSLLEASYDLGASRIKTFFNITLPLTLPGIFAGFTLVFIPAVGLFFISDLLGGAKTMLLGNLIRDQFTTARNWPFGGALAIVMLIIVLFFVNLYRKFSKDLGGLF